MGSRRFDRARIWGTLSLVALTGCAGIGHAPGPAANAAYLATIAERQVSGNTGTVVGRLYLAQPAIPTPLTGWTVTLLPLSPTQESALNQARSPYLDGGREPLSPERFDAARSFLNRLQLPRGGISTAPVLFDQPPPIMSTPDLHSRMSRMAAGSSLPSCPERSPHCSGPLR